ncbi:MAG: DUF4062 domain-containing protein [Nitrospira sp.]
MSHRFRVFIASPGDVPLERSALVRAVEEINVTTCPLIGCTLEVVKWESNAVPDAGRPQQVINDQIPDFDIFVGVMWRRFGTPTGIAESGTEEEYRIACARWQKEPSMPLMFYFCQEPFYSNSLEELEQFKKVLLFRKELDGKALTWTYGEHAVFEGTIRKHLCQRLPKLVEAREGTRRSRATPSEDSIMALHDLWPKLDAGTQRAINIAYNENRLAGDPGIQTRDLFSALLRVQDAPLQQVVLEIPETALPKPTAGPVTDEPYILAERPWLSGCVASSIRRLNKLVPAGHKITPTDIFADIAKNGTGASVALLREHNVGPTDIDAILRRKGISALGV